MKDALEKANIEKQQTLAAQAQAQQAALAEQRSADLAKAKADNQLAGQVSGAVWKNLEPNTRAVILDDQRAWIRKKAADCDVAAAAASTDSTEQETAKLKCDTQATQERTQELQRTGQ